MSLFVLCWSQSILEGPRGGGARRDCLISPKCFHPRLGLPRDFAKSLSSPGKTWALIPVWGQCQNSEMAFLPEVALKLGLQTVTILGQRERRACSQDGNSALRRRVLSSYVATSSVPSRKSMTGSRFGSTSALGIFHCPESTQYPSWETGVLQEGKAVFILRSPPQVNNFLVT